MTPTLPTVDTLQTLLAELSELDARVEKGADLLSQERHWLRDDPTTLRYESAWLDLCRQQARKYEELLTAWKASGQAIEWEFPPDAPVALPKAHTRLPDGWYAAWLTYEEFRLCMIAVTTAKEIPV